MGKLHLSIFSFDSRIDFQNGFVRQDICYKSSDTLKDVFACIDYRLFGYQEFGVDLDFIHCRINGYAIFGNINIDILVDKFGNEWNIEPISRRYAKKDLLLDIDMAFNKYNSFFQQMDFITPSQKNELKKYIFINFISDCHDDSYLGDGFFLYIKWLISKHPLQKDKLLKFVSTNDGNIFEHVSVNGFVFPKNKIIDQQIEYMQSMILSRDSLQNEWASFGMQVSRKYGFSCVNKIVGHDMDFNSYSMQDILSPSEKL